MNHSDLLDFLLATTGDLQPTSETTVAELDDLRRAFLQSFQQKQMYAQPAAPLSAASRLTAELEYLVAQHLAGPPAESAVSLVRRKSPVRVPIDPATPEWTVGLAPARTFGPFTDRAGNLL
jgi:hypothetical protein